MPALIGLGVILLIAWFLLVFVVKAAFGLVHLLVVVALALIIFGFIKRGARNIAGR